VNHALEMMINFYYPTLCYHYISYLGLGAGASEAGDPGTFPPLLVGGRA
jgi:hypothetical protein